MILSVVGANTLGSAWFDGVTPIAGRPRWTHLWEQGFADRRRVSTPTATAPRPWPAPSAGVGRVRWTASSTGRQPALPDRRPPAR